MLRRPFLQFQRTFAGHSHWANIKHKKGKNDAGRAALFGKISKEIRSAVKVGQSADPQFNFQLNAILKRATKASIPKAVINKAIEKSQTESVELSKMIYELSGSKGSMIVVEMLTDNSRRALEDIRTIIAKLPCSMAPTGSLLFNFNDIGIVTLAYSDSQEDSLLEVVDGIATDIDIEGAPDGEAIVYCEPNNLQNLIKRLAEREFQIVDQQRSRIPIQTVILPEEEAPWFQKLLEGLYDNPEVIDVFTNVNEN